MEYLLKIYEKNNLTEAAKELFISPQALSKMIRSIEEEYDEEIIVRNGNRFVFSQFGQSLVNESKKMLSFYSTFNRNVDHYKKISKENIYLDMPINTSLIFGYKYLQRFKENYPQYNLIISEYNDYQIEHRALSEISDISLFVDDIQSPELFDIKKIVECKFGILVSNKHPLAKKDEVSLLDIVPYPIVTRNEDYKIYYKLENYSKLYNVTFDYSLRTCDGLAVTPMLSDNYTVSIAVGIMNGVKEEEHKFIPFSEDITWKLSRAIKKEKINDEKIKAFTSFFDQIGDNIYLSLF